MISIRRLSLIFIPLFLIATLHLLLAVNYTRQQNDGYLGATLDDTWIHVRFADFIAQGQGLAYNPPELTAGATSPLWVLLLAIPYALFEPGKQGQVEWAIGLSAFFHVLTVLAIAGLGWSVTRRAWIGLAAGLLTALTGRLIWMGLSGMETTCFMFFCIVAIWSYTTERQFGLRTGVLTALATLARPEGYLLAVVIGIDAFVLLPLFIQNRKYFHNFLHAFRAGWQGIFAYLLLAGSYVIVTYAISGHPLPNTFRVKNELGRTLPDLPLAYYWTPRADHGWLLIAVGVLGLGYLLWQAYRRQITGYLWILWATVFVLAVLFMGHNRYVINHARYVAPAIPFHMLLVAAGLGAISDALHRWKLPPYLAPTGLTLLAALLTLNSLDQGAKRVALDVKQLHTMHVQAADWINANTSPQAAIALNDVGAIVHLSDRKVIDVVGLVTPEIIDLTQDSQFMTCRRDLEIASYLVREKPAMIGIFPNWYWCLVQWGVLEEMTAFKITGPHLLGGDTMVFYRPHWDRWMFLDAVPTTATPLQAHFQEGIELAAADIEREGNRLTITLYWRSHGTPTQDYHIFTHLFDSSGNLIGQQDGQPQGGRIPMSWWQPGFLLADTYTLDVADAALLDQAGLSLRVGVYAFEQGYRLQRVDEGAMLPDAVELTLPE